MDKDKSLHIFDSITFVVAKDFPFSPSSRESEKDTL